MKKIFTQTIIISIFISQNISSRIDLGKELGKGIKKIEKGISGATKEIQKGVSKVIVESPECFITNYTPLKLTLATKVTGPHKLVKNKHFKIVSQVIPPWKRKRIIEFKPNLPTRSLKKTTFTIETQVTARDKNNRPIDKPVTFIYNITTPATGVIAPLTFKKQVKISNKIFTNEGFIGTVPKIPKKGIFKNLKLKPSKGIWTFSGTYDRLDYKNRIINIYSYSYPKNINDLFKSKGIDISKNHGYIFHLKEFTEAKFDENKNTLRVLLYNIWSRPMGAFLFDGQIERLKRIPRSISGMFKNYKPDIVVFNEDFEQLADKHLRSNMKKEGFLHTTKVLGSKAIGKIIKGKMKISNGGVVVFSKWPIVHTEEKIYKICGGPDCIAAKGVLYVKINKKGKIYHIFATHPQSGQSHRNELEKQLETLKDFILEQNIAKNEPVIIAGDMNVYKYKIPEEYMFMLKTLNATHPEHKVKSTNHTGDFLDYVLYKKDHQNPKKCFNKVLTYGRFSPAPWRKCSKSINFKNIPALAIRDYCTKSENSDHCPVLGVFEF